MHLKSSKSAFSGISPYSQSRMHDLPRLEKESWDLWEVRTWREKCNANDKG